MTKKKLNTMDERFYRIGKVFLVKLSCGLVVKMQLVSESPTPVSITKQKIRYDKTKDCMAAEFHLSCHGHEKKK